MTEKQDRELARVSGIAAGLSEAWDIALRYDSIHELRHAIAKRAMQETAKHHAMLDECLGTEATIKEIINA